MSFLNQMLASIGSGSPSVPTQTPNARPSGSRPSLQTNSNETATPKPSAPGNSVQAGVKRKAENDNGSLQGQQKAARIDLGSSGNRSIAKPQPAGSAGSPPSEKPPYQGTIKSVISKPITSNTTGSPAPGSVTPGSAAPKKGYLATLERAKAAQAAKSSVGVIKHKPLERLAKKDRLALKAEAAGRKKSGSGQDTKPAPTSKDPRNSTKAGDTSKGKPKASDPGYKGTMRPAAAPTPAYKGTMRSSSTTAIPKARSSGLDKSRYGDRSRSSSVVARPKDKGRMAGYASYSEADSRDEDEEDEEEEDYESDVSSDMEAGMADVDEEEALSLRVARKEDDEALKEESELKARKEARKKAVLVAGKRV